VNSQTLAHAEDHYSPPGMRQRIRLIGLFAGVASLAPALLLSPSQAAGHTSSRRPACTIVGTRDSETLRGTSGDDVICAREGDDDILARGGDDVVYAGRGDDDVVAGAGADVVFGERGRDEIFGGSGPDRLFGQRGADNGITGAGGRDLLSGGRRADGCLDGRDDRPGDRLRGGPGRDGYAADEGDLLRSVENGAGCPVQTPPPTGRAQRDLWASGFWRHFDTLAHQTVLHPSYSQPTRGFGESFRTK
jgi:hypothetical protein